MSAPVIRKIGGNYRPYRHGEYIGGGMRREEIKPPVARGHRVYIGEAPIRTTNNMAEIADRHRQELLRRDLWLHCERAPFDRLHP